MKGFYWYLLKTLRSFRKANIAIENFCAVEEQMDESIKRKPYEAFYNFVETHKGVLRILNVNFDLYEDEPEHYVNWLNIKAFDKVLKVKRSYVIYIETGELFWVEEAD